MDGINWFNTSITGANLGNGSQMFVTGNGSQWLLTTNSPSVIPKLYYSYDGYAWYGNTTFSNSTSNFYKPYYNGSFWWIGTDQNDPGQNMYYSADGVNWSNNILTGGYCNGGYPTAFTSRFGFSNAQILMISTMIGLETSFATQQLFASSISTGIITAGSMYVSSLFINVTSVSTTNETINNISTQYVDYISAGRMVANQAYIENLSVNRAYISTARINALSTNFISAGQMIASSIGINCNAPSVRLDVVGGTTLNSQQNVIAQFTDGNTNNGVVIGSITGNTPYIGDNNLPGGNGLSFRTSNVDRIRIRSDGYVGINCNNPRGFSQRAHCQGRKKK
jgi:hypothetical protein